MANNQFVYRNLNTGQDVARDSRSSRFDALPQWVLVAIPDDLGKPQPVAPVVEPPAVQPGLIGSSQVAGPKAPVEPVEPVAPVEPEEPVEPVALVAPARNATKDEWVEYALSVGGDPAKVASMKRDDLIAEFGE